MVDSVRNHLGLSIYSKLSRSKNTGLMPPINTFVPWAVFRHLCNLTVGYGGNMKSFTKKIELTIDRDKTARRVFSPVRINGTNCLKKRVYKRVLENGKYESRLHGRVAVIVSKRSPIICAFNKKRETLCVTFYVQRYDVNDLALDLSLQRLIS